MKRILLIILTLISISSSASAMTCVKKFNQRIENIQSTRPDGGTELMVGGFGGAGVGVAIDTVSLVATGNIILATAAVPLLYPIGIGGLVVAGAGIGADAIVRKVKIVRVKKMIRLVDQSEEFVLSGIEGKLLLKVFKAVKKKQPEITLLDLANKILKGNDDLSLCPGNMYVAKVDEQLY